MVGWIPFREFRPVEACASRKNLPRPTGFRPDLAHTLSSCPVFLPSLLSQLAAARLYAASFT